MSAKELVETVKKTLNELKAKHKPEPGTESTIVFLYAGRTFSFFAKHNETGRAEIQTKLTLKMPFRSPAEFEKVRNQWVATLGSDEHAGPEADWHSASLIFSATKAGEDKTLLYIRYQLGEDESDALAQVKEPETVKGICDFLIVYADIVKTVDDAMEG